MKSKKIFPQNNTKYTPKKKKFLLKVPPHSVFSPCTKTPPFI